MPLAVLFSQAYFYFVIGDEIKPNDHGIRQSFHLTHAEDSISSWCPAVMIPEHVRFELITIWFVLNRRVTVDNLCGATMTRNQRTRGRGVVFS